MSNVTQPEYLTLKADPGPNDPVIGASGTAYRWHLDLSVPRHKALDLLGTEFMYSMTFAEVIESDNRMWEHMKNKPDFTEAVIELYKRREHMILLKEGRNAGIEISSIFLLGPSENPAVFDAEEQRRKVADLEAGGYRNAFFFSAALDAVEGFRPLLLKLLRALSIPSLNQSPTEASPPASDSTNSLGLS